jgi:hypothetical protein
MARYQNQLAELRQVDADENAKALRDAAGQKRALVAPVQAGVAPLEEAVTTALTAERAAADRLRGARKHLREVTRAEQKARRDMASPEMLTEALLRVRAAVDVTGDIRQAAERATTARVAAEQALAAHQQRLAVLEDEAVAAERAAASPPAAVPPSAWTCLLGSPLALLMQPDLGAEGSALLAAQIGTLARLSGVADELKAQSRAQLEAEQADKARHPHQVQVLGNGEVGVLPNPLHPDVPTQATPPGPNAGHGLSALFPGLA